MNWFDKSIYWRIDPDHRYKPEEKADGPCNTRKMTDEEWKKYGPKSNKQKQGLLLTNSDYKGAWNIKKSISGNHKLKRGVANDKKTDI